MFKKCYLLLFFVFIFLNFRVLYNCKYIEKDYAFANTDYNEIEGRKKLVLSDLKYSSKINYYSDFKSSYFDNLTYNFGMNYKESCAENHVHTYDSYYETYSSSRHKAYCGCGNYTLAAHSINSSTQRIINGHVYANCRDCNALVDLGKTIVINPSLLNRFNNICLITV